MADNKTFIDDLGINQFGDLGHYCEKIVKIREELEDCPEMVVVRKEDLDNVLNALQDKTINEINYRRRCRARSIGRNFLFLLASSALALNPKILQDITEKVSPYLIMPALVGIYALSISGKKGQDEENTYYTYNTILDKIAEMFNNREKEKEGPVLKG